MKVTIKAILWTYKKSQSETYPIKICIRVNRKATYLHTGKFVAVNQFQAGRVVRHKDANVINNIIQTRINELERTMLNKQMNGQAVTCKSLLQNNVCNFYSYAKQVRNVPKELNRLINFANHDLMVSDIDVDFLRRYEKHERERNMSNNTVNTTFKYLRRILNQAVSEGLITRNPINDYLMPRYIQTDRVFLTEPELNKMKSIVGKVSGTQEVVLNFFLLGCYSGLRHSDWLRFNAQKMVDGNMLKLRAKKNHTWVTLPIGNSLAKIIKRVHGTVPSNQKCNVYLKSLGAMAGLDKEITCHSARHSFGYLCASNGLPKQVTAELMGISVKTVEVYYHLEGSDILKQAHALLNV